MYHDNLMAGTSSAFPRYSSQVHSDEAWMHGHPHNRTFHPLDEESEPDPPPPPPPGK